MEIKLSKINIDSLALLTGINPQKLRHYLETAGEVQIPEDGFVNFDDVLLGLWGINEDWDQIIGPIEISTIDLTRPKSREPRLYSNLAEAELDQVSEILKLPNEPARIEALATFLSDHNAFKEESRIWAAAYSGILAGSISNSNNFENVCKTNYITSRTWALLQEEQFIYASEMAFAGLSCGTELRTIEKDDYRVKLYFETLLVAAGSISYPFSYDFSIEELLSVGFESDQLKTTENFKNGVRRALFFCEYLFERLKLSRDVRILVRKNLDSLKGKLELNPDYQGEDLYSRLAEQITHSIRALESTGEGFLTISGFTGIEQYRSRLIKRIQPLLDFATQQEQETIDGFLQILREPLTGIINQRNTGHVRNYGQSHAQMQTMCKNLEQQITERPSWLTICYIKPILYWFKNCLDNDFRDRTSVYTTTVDLVLSKKEYPLKIGEKQVVGIFTKNTGNSDAENVNVSFQTTTSVELPPKLLTFGDLAVGTSSSELSLDMKVLEERVAYEIPYNLSWKNLTGENTKRSGTLKLLPQRKIDWKKYQTNPYSISSIKENEPERLKGRADKLTILRMGLGTMQSFFVTGQKRVGKSSIVNVYYGELLNQNNVLPVRFLWGYVADCNLPMLGEAMAQYMNDAWKDKTKNDLAFEVPTIEQFKMSFSRTFSDFLNSFHREFPEWKIVFIIDDFDEVRQELYKGEAGDAFFTTLRAFIDRDFSSFIIVGSENLPVTILREQGRKVNQADTLEVDCLGNRRDFKELVIEPTKDVLFFDQDAISEIFELTAGNPYYANLLCSRIFRFMFNEQDYYVSKGDVIKAAKLLATEDKEKSYNHFWTDGIHDIGEERKRIEYNNAMTLIALSKSDSDAARYADIRSIFQQPEVHHLETAELEYRLNELADRHVIERDTISPNRFRIKVNLFESWLKSGGAHQIRQGFGQYEYTIRPLKEYALFPEEIIQIAEGLVYRGENIDRILVETWLRQFGDEYNQRLAYKVLCRLKETGFYSVEKFNHALETLFKKAVASVNGWAQVVDKRLIRNVLVCFVDPVGKSGATIVTEFRRVNQIYNRLCGSLEEIAEILGGRSDLSQYINRERRWLLFMVDDFIGTGRQGSEYLIKAIETLDQKAPNWESLCHPFYSLVCGFEDAAESIELASGNRVQAIIADPLEDKDRAFSPRAGIFLDDRERNIAKSLFSKIGMSLEKKHPLGYGASEALIVFPNSIPNNTLPVFYKQGHYEGRLWTPLFLRV